MTLDGAQNTVQMKRGLSRIEAALYIGVGTTKFDDLVDSERMPKPRCIDRRKVWDVRELDASFDDLPRPHDANDSNPWD